jgi:hypothetical protein
LVKAQREEVSMRKILLAAAILAPLGACTYVNDTQPGYSSGYGYGTTTAPATAYRGGDSYERERQAYEYGRRDGNSTSRGWR